MKRIYATLLCALALMGVKQVSAQDYHYFVYKGASAGGYWSPNSTLTSILSDGNDIMSEPRKLPFSFSFYGQTVTHYRVSDNGYITFDTSENVSRPANYVLPNAANKAPRMSILGFWDDFELIDATSGKDEVVVWNVTTPTGDEAFCIGWSGVTPKGKSNATNAFVFVIQVYKSNRIEIFHAARQGTTALSGTVGINKDATTGVCVDDDNTLDFPNTASVGFVKYEFLPGRQPNNDVMMMAADNSNALIRKGVIYGASDMVVRGAFQNRGKTAITSLELSYQLDGGTVTTSNLPVSSPGIPANGGLASFGFKPAGLNKGSQELKFWISKINGNADDSTGNDNPTTLTVFVHEGKSSAKKKVLLEEFTTAVCQYCPGGHALIEQLKANYPDGIYIAHHAGFYTDAMTVTEHTEIASRYTNAAPTATVDRVHYTNEPNVAINTSLWETRLKGRQDAFTTSPVEVKAFNTYDAATRKLKVKVDATFHDAVPVGPYNLHLILVEDNVTGTGSGYNQVNAYNTVANHPMYGKGNPIINYNHRDVTRSFPTGAWGELDIIDDNPVVGKVYTKEYNVTLDPKWDANDMHVVAFVSSYANGDFNDRIVLNAVEVGMLSNGIAETSANNIINALYPNPTTGRTNVMFTLTKPGQVSATIVDVTGRTIQSIATSGNYATGVHTLGFDASTLSKGIYFLNLNVDGQISAQKVIVE